MVNELMSLLNPRWNILCSIFQRLVFVSVDLRT